MSAPEDQFPDLYRAWQEQAKRMEGEEVQRLRVRCQELHEKLRRLKRGEDVDIETEMAA